MQRKLILAGGLAAAYAIASYASAETLFSNRGTGLDGPDVFSSAINGNLIEDGHFAGSGPFNLTAINLGYDNIGPTPINADVLVTFFDTVDYNGLITNPVASTQIGPTHRFSFIAFNGSDETGFLSIPGGLLFPDTSFGVMVNFVSPNTEIPLATINHLFRDIPTSIGTSDELFAYDLDLNNVIDGTEVFTWEGGGFPAGNLFMEIQGEAVPEPASLAALSLGTAGLLRRRRSGR